MSKVIQIDVADSERIERAQYEYMSYVNVEKSYLDDHMLDPDGNAINSPIFREYHKMTIEALVVYETAKNDMVEKYGIGTAEWQLDFASKEVTIG